MADIRSLTLSPTQYTTLLSADLLYSVRGGVPGKITGEAFITGVPGRLLSRQVVNSVGSHAITPPTGAKRVIVKAIGSGGPGGAADSDAGGTSADAAAGSGGTSGSYAEFEIDVSASGWTATAVVGALGTLGTVGVAGTPAADSTFTTNGGVTITIPGGQAGINSADSLAVGLTTLATLPALATLDAGSVEWFEAKQAARGDFGMYIPRNATNNGSFGKGGDGGSLLGAASKGGAVASTSASSPGEAGPVPGAGGAGAASVGTATESQGGQGKAGQFEFWWFS